MLKIFHSDRQARVELVQLLDDLELVEMVIVPVMGRADENYTLGCELRNQPSLRERRAPIDRLQ